jgi:hypothetical protein
VFAATVQQRASFDLDCSIRDVTVQNIGGNSYGVTGCGRKVSYSCLCAWSSWGKCTQPMCSVDGKDRTAITKAGRVPGALTNEDDTLP